MALDAATQETEKRKREALSAMAASGQAGVQAYDQAQGQVASMQNQAIDQALAGTIAQQADPRARAELSQIIRQPGDLMQQSLAAGKGRFQADMARQSASNADYFSQANAAVPLMQAQANKEIGLMRERWNQQRVKEEKEKSDTELRQIAAGEAEAKRNAALETATGAQRQIVDERGALMKEKATLDQEVLKLEAQAARDAQKMQMLGPVGRTSRSLSPEDKNAMRSEAKKKFVRAAVPPQFQARKNEIAQRLLAIDSEIQKTMLDREFGPTTDAPIAGIPDNAVARRGSTQARDAWLTANAGPEAQEHLATAYANRPLENFEFDDVAAQRQALIDQGVDPMRAAGMIPQLDPTAEMEREVAQLELEKKYGDLTTPKQQSLKDAATPKASPEVVGAALGFEPEEVAVYTGRKAQPLMVDPIKGGLTPQVDEDGQPLAAISVYDEAAAEFEARLKMGFSVQAASAATQAHLQDNFGHDYPKIRQMLEGVYSGVQ